MTIKEAAANNLIVQYWDHETGNFPKDKWRLVLEKRNNALVVADEGYSTEEVERLVDLKERVIATPDFFK